jgi:chemotaxis protein methyltransferase CheR
MAGPLTAPDDSALAQLETSLFVEGVYRRYGVDFRGFEAAAFGRRLGALLASSGTATISALQGRVLHDVDFARDAMRHLSASASDFFTSEQCFTVMRCAALPVLRSASWPLIWVAECGDARLLKRLTAMLGEEGLLGKTQVFVTNANDDLLAEVAAQAGCEAHHNIVFGQYDLASDASFNEFHLVLCQRPLKDFDVALQRRALGLFSESLCNFGILQVEPPSDVLGNEFGKAFGCLLGEQGLYRRLP